MKNKYQILKSCFGYDDFREGQEQLIDSILSGSDCLGVMPTGAGKSICFQIPALMLGGITLVISPLISLMKDQVSALRQVGVKAAYINTSLTERQIFLALENASKGMYDIIYVAPERLESADFLSFVKQADISMLTVDEAHCISQWGQDFRPSYLKIASFMDALAKRPVISAFTATATLEVREDIINMLKLNEPTVLVTGFDRKNLHFGVKKPEDKFQALIDFLTDNKEKFGIIYCATRKTVEEVCERLRNKGYSASRYHAGLTDWERSESQDDFLYDRIKIMVATNAFGMGIDKSNVGFVIHYNMPKNIESYYQEAGRAGRDGEPSDCLLLYSGQDVRINLYLIENSKDVEYPDYETEKLLKERDRQRLSKMNMYCHTSDCLRGYILNYFGEKIDSSYENSSYCGNCGNCLSDYETVDITVEAQKILSCVIKSGERYGAVLIIDVLRGSKSEKIRRMGLDRLSTYNISTLTDKRLRDIINYLILNNYLLVTDDKYPVLKRGANASEVLRGKTEIKMKMAKDAPERVREKNYPADKALLEKLKALRSEIAKEQGVPAFLIFHDSTLMDMCIKLPVSEAELMKVLGVGQTKLERYGKRFLEVIDGFISDTNNRGSQHINEAVQHPADSNALALSYSNIELSEEPVTISIVADRINCVLLQMGIPKVTATKLNEMLVREGYLMLQANEGGGMSKVPTALGADTGMTSVERESRGNRYLISFFDINAQRLIIDKCIR